MKAIVVIDLHEDFKFPAKADVKIRTQDKTIYRTHMRLKPLPKGFGIDIVDDYAKGWNDFLKEITK